MKDVIKCLALASALLTIQKMNADTNDAYTVQDMFQTVVTPTEFSTTQSQHDQLPDILTMPKLDKEALYLFYKELYGEQQKMIQIRRQFMQSKSSALLLDWEPMTYTRYSDGLLEFDFYASKEGDAKKHYHVFQDKTGKFYENTPPAGNRTLVKKWNYDKYGRFGTIVDYKNNIKWSGYLAGMNLPTTKTLEFTEITKLEDKEHRYYYKAEFSSNPKAFVGETKFKTTHISTINGKSSKPIVTETVYKGVIFWPFLRELGGDKGFPPMKTFKTIRD